MTEPKGIALLGATGSIGETAQRVVARHPDRFRFTAMTAHGNRDALVAQLQPFVRSCFFWMDMQPNCMRPTFHQPARGTQ